FRAPEAGRIVRAKGGYDAFLPAPLPPKLVYDDELVLALSRADAALSELSGLGRHLPNPHLLIAPYVRREAVLSSRIEGTMTTLRELLLEEVAEGAARRDPADVREVRNYVAALEHGVGRLLITLFLIERARLSQPLLYLSAYIDRHRGEYYDGLQAVHTDGDWKRWIRFFLTGVEMIAQEAVAQAAQLMELRERWRERLADYPKAAQLLDALLVNPYMSVARAERLLKVSNPTARQLVARL